jgi:hypothetical protein
LVRTEDEIRQSFINRAEGESGIVTEFQERGRLDKLFSVVAAEFVAFEELIDSRITETNVVTATERESLEKLATPFYLPISPTYSECILTVTRDGTVVDDIEIPIGTIFETSETNPRQYIATKTKWLYSGQDVIKLRVRSINTGANTAVNAGELNVVVNNLVAGINVINSQGSWGGYDGDTESDIRRAVMSARYEFEAGLKSAIENTLREYGLPYYKYNLEEFAFGEGTCAVYIDTTSDEELFDIQTVVEREIGAGIYDRFEKAIPLEMDFSFTVNLYAEHDLLPNERDELKRELETVFTSYVEEVGVGQSIIVSKAKNWLFDQLLDTYEIYDIEISLVNYTERINSKGNIDVESNEVAKVSNVSVDIHVG